MPSALRIRLYPSHEQEFRMLRALEECRRLWNEALSHRKDRWQNERKSTSYNLQQWILTAERHESPGLASLHSQVAQDVLHRIDNAFTAFFQSRAKYPKFKKFSESGSFTYSQAYNGSVKPDLHRRRLFLSRIGNVPCVFHRQLPKDSRMKTCTLVREPDGKWFASMVFEQVVPLQDVLPLNVERTTTPIGVDLGLLSIITTSEGEKVKHPHLLRKAEKKLKHVQRVFSRKKKKSNNWYKAKQRLASQHAHVRRQRMDFNHKLSTKLVRAHGLIAFEDLKVRNMVKSHSFAKSIHDAGWGQLVKLTERKALVYGSVVVKVPAAFSTQECFFCNSINPVEVSIREFACRSCGRVLDRDINAAKVVLKRGLAKVGLDRPEPKPAEIGPLRAQATGPASLVEETGTKRADHVRALEAHDNSRGRMSQPFQADL